MSFESCLFSGHYVLSQTDQTTSKLQAANDAVNQAFNAVLDAEKAGANVTDLLTKLNDADSFLAQAENSYRTGDLNVAATQADSAIPIAHKVTISAQVTKQTALDSSLNASVLTITFTVDCAFAFAFVLFFVWRRFKRGYIKSLSKTKPEVNSH